MVGIEFNFRRMRWQFDLKFSHRPIVVNCTFGLVGTHVRAASRAGCRAYQVSFAMYLSTCLIEVTLYVPSALTTGM